LVEWQQRQAGQRQRNTQRNPGVRRQQRLRGDEQHQ